MCQVKSGEMITVPPVRSGRMRARERSVTNGGAEFCKSCEVGAPVSLFRDTGIASEFWLVHLPAGSSLVQLGRLDPTVDGSGVSGTDAQRAALRSLRAGPGDPHGGTPTHG